MVKEVEKGLNPRKVSRPGFMVWGLNPFNEETVIIDKKIGLRAGSCSRPNALLLVTVAESIATAQELPSNGGNGFPREFFDGERVGLLDEEVKTVSFNLRRGSVAERMIYIGDGFEYEIEFRGYRGSRVDLAFRSPRKVIELKQVPTEFVRNQDISWIMRTVIQGAGPKGQNKTALSLRR